MSGLYEGPPKYLSQRDQPLEVPSECVRRLINAIDTTMDDRIEVREIEDYVARLQLPFEEGICQKMFDDAIKGRGYINEQ